MQIFFIGNFCDRVKLGMMFECDFDNNVEGGEPLSSVGTAGVVGDRVE